MLEEDFGPEGDKDDTAEGLDFAFEEVAQFFADVDAEVRQNESHYADYYHGKEEADNKERKSDSNGEGVDTGSEGEGKEGRETCGVEILLFGLDFEGLVNHFCADGCQQEEGEPMVPADDEFPDGQTGEGADERHAGLEEAEEQGHSQGVFHLQLLIGGAGDDGHGKGIHGKGHGYYNDVE